MVLLYYIYLLGTYHWLLSLILSVHFRNWMHLNINIVNIYIWLLATTRKLRKSPAFQFLVLAVNHFVLMAILNTCNISIKYKQWYVYLVCYIHCIYPLTGEWHRSMPFRTFFEKKVEFHRNSKNEVMRIPRMCSTHKTDFKTSNFYNKIPSRIQIRVAWCLSIYIKVVTFNVHITYNIYISCVLYTKSTRTRQNLASIRKS